MVQKLLVEGENDKHVVMNLAKARNLPFPKGYENPLELMNFVVDAGSKEKLLRAVKLEVRKPEITNLGIIIDANSSLENTWQAVKNVLERADYENLPIRPDQDGIIITQAEKPKVGIWIMPDNQSQGYLEYFLADLIPPQDDLLPLVRQNVQHLLDNNLNRFTEIRRQKTEIHTWLAWQPTPGMPMGMAISANYFDCNVALATHFIAWLQNTFEFELA